MNLRWGFGERVFGYGITRGECNIWMLAEKSHWLIVL